MNSRRLSRVFILVSMFIWVVAYPTLLVSAEPAYSYIVKTLRGEFSVNEVIFVDEDDCAPEDLDPGEEQHRVFAINNNGSVGLDITIAMDIEPDTRGGEFEVVPDKFHMEAHSGRTFTVIYFASADAKPDDYTCTIEVIR